MGNQSYENKNVVQMGSEILLHIATLSSEEIECIKAEKPNIEQLKKLDQMPRSRGCLVVYFDEEKEHLVPVQHLSDAGIPGAVINKCERIFARLHVGNKLEVIVSQYSNRKMVVQVVGTTVYVDTDKDLLELINHGGRTYEMRGLENVENLTGEFSLSPSGIAHHRLADKIWNYRKDSTEVRNSFARENVYKVPSSNGSSTVEGWASRLFMENILNWKLKMANPV